MQTKFNYDAKGKFIIATDDERLFDKIYYMLMAYGFDASQLSIARDGKAPGVYIDARDIEDPEQFAGDLEWTFHGGNGLREYFTQTDRYGYTTGDLYDDNDELPESQDNVISLGTCCCPEEAQWRVRVHNCNVQSFMVGESPCDEWFIPPEDKGF